MTMNGGMAQPSIGKQVMTADGKELGKVKEISGGCFKIDAPLAPDYWLSTDTVSDATTSVLRLSLTRDGLDNAKIDGPQHTGYHRHN